MKGKILLWVSIIMILVGGIVANLVQDDFCKVQVRDVRFAAMDGRIMSALLFIPKNATVKTPAPGILAIHGYINSRETQSGFAIEFARRGWVVLELDQSGHGYSDPPVGADGYGAIDGLAYLRSLDFVDKNKIGLEGHSMGGWASVVAAATHPNDYKAMVLEGSSTETMYSKKYVPIPGTPTFPRNLAVVLSTMDEFGWLMWEVPIAKDAVNSKALEKVFGVDTTIEPGKIYGSIEDGTARVLYQPKTTHPGDHLSQAAIGYAVEWFQKTLGEVKPIPTGNQIWYWKSIATLVAFIGGILLLFAAGGHILNTGYFSRLKGEPQNVKPATGAGWWIGAALTFIIPTITYLYLGPLGSNIVMKPSWLFPQKETNGIMFWLVVNAILSLIFFAIWHLASNKKKGGTMASYGLKASSGFKWKTFWLSLWYAIIVVSVLYLSLIIIAFFFKVDFRFWVVALKPMSPLQARITLRYLIPFGLFYLMFAVVLHGQLRVQQGSLTRRMIINTIVASGGYLVLLLIMYVPLLAGGKLGIPDVRMTLYAIIAIQLFPLFIIVSLISTYFYEKTGLVYAGMFVNTLFITWYIVAGQATHFPLY
jgi:pimeloyl-ACP methyl ester carboxylesterase